jgi:ubiquitin carboxyl-terminal hydrolase 8
MEINSNGLSSLVNVGNTCYINSSLQCLLHTKQLNVFFDTKFNIYNKNTNDFVLTKEYNDLRKLLWSKNCTIYPNRFINIIQKVALVKNRDEFSQHNQCCASDFTQFLIECMHSSIQREVNININGQVINDQDSIAIKCFESQKRFYQKEYSELIPIFSAIQVTSIIDLHDSKEEPNYVCEPFMSIILPIPNKVKGETLTLNDCFKEYTKNETVVLGSKEKEKKIMFWSLPDVLIITLSRFHNDAKRKITNVVDSKLDNINLSEFVIGYDKEKYIYNIYATCEHSGNQQGGHYTANIKTNNKWYNIDDNIINQISESKVINGKTYVIFLDTKCY